MINANVKRAKLEAWTELEARTELGCVVGRKEKKVRKAGRRRSAALRRLRCVAATAVARLLGHTQGALGFPVVSPRLLLVSARQVVGF